MVDVTQQLPPLPDAGERSALQQPPHQARTQSFTFPSRAVRLNTCATLISVTPTGAVQCMILTDAVQRCGAPHKLLPCAGSEFLSRTRFWFGNFTGGGGGASQLQRIS